MFNEGDSDEEEMGEQEMAGLEGSGDAEAMAADAVSQIQDIFSTDGMDIQESNDRVSKTLKKYFVESKSEKRNRLVESSNYLKGKINTVKKLKSLSESYKSVEQELMTQKVLKRYPQLNIVGQKGSNIVLESNKKVIEVSPKGQLIY